MHDTGEACPLIVQLYAKTQNFLAIGGLNITVLNSGYVHIILSWCYSTSPKSLPLTRSESSGNIARSGFYIVMLLIYAWLVRLILRVTLSVVLLLS